MTNSKEALNIVSLNIEGQRNLSLVTPFLETSSADAILLQEVFEANLNPLARSLHMAYNFTPMCRRPLEYYSLGELHEWGVAILAREMVALDRTYYHGDPSQLPEFGQGIVGNIAPVVVSSLVRKNRKLFSLATTHFPWAADGKASDLQRTELASLLRILSRLRDVILVGDFNAPRGGEIFGKLSAKYRDWIPSEITTTIDGARHKAGYLQLVVDGLFTSPEYEARNVELVDGVSDHWAITAQIYRVDG